MRARSAGGRGRARRRLQRWVLPIAWLLSGPVFAQWISDTQAVMGTRVHVELWSEAAEDGSTVVAAVFAEMRRIDAAFSPYQDDSELSRITLIHLLVCGASPLHQRRAQASQTAPAL